MDPIVRRSGRQRTPSKKLAEMQCKKSESNKGNKRKRETHADARGSGAKTKNKECGNNTSKRKIADSSSAEGFPVVNSCILSPDSQLDHEPAINKTNEISSPGPHAVCEESQVQTSDDFDEYGDEQLSDLGQHSCKTCELLPDMMSEQSDQSSHSPPSMSIDESCLVSGDLSTVETDVQPEIQECDGNTTIQIHEVQDDDGAYFSCINLKEDAGDATNGIKFQLHPDPASINKFMEPEELSESGMTLDDTINTDVCQTSTVLGVPVSVLNMYPSEVKESKQENIIQSSSGMNEVVTASSSPSEASIIIHVSADGVVHTSEESDLFSEHVTGIDSQESPEDSMVKSCVSGTGQTYTSDITQVIASLSVKHETDGIPSIPAMSNISGSAGENCEESHIQVLVVNSDQVTNEPQVIQFPLSGLCEPQTSEENKHENEISSPMNSFTNVHTPIEKSKKGDTDYFMEIRDGVLCCLHCSYTTDKKANWYKHKKKHLSNAKSHQCHYCDYKAANSSNLNRHIQIHENARNYECIICGKKFRQKVHVERHINYIHGDKDIECKLCSFKCAHYNPDLVQHMKRKHSMNEDGSKIDPKDGSTQLSVQTDMKCPDCSYTTVSKKNMQQHLKFHRKGPEMKLFCTHCSYVTDCPSRLKRHNLSHSGVKPFECGICHYRATQKEHVIRHMAHKHKITFDNQRRRSRRNSESAAEFSMDTVSGSLLMTGACTQGASKKYLVPDFCTKPKNFACHFCSMRFTKLMNLFKHVNIQHGDVIPQEEGVFSCVICEYRTYFKKNLLVHMRKHGTGSPSTDCVPRSMFTCPLCDYCRPFKLDLFAHMKKAHNMQLVTHKDGVYQYMLEDNGESFVFHPPPKDEAGESASMALPSADSLPGVASAQKGALLDGETAQSVSLLSESCGLGDASLGKPQDEVDQMGMGGTITRTVLLQMDTDTPPMPVEIVTSHPQHGNTGHPVTDVETLEATINVQDQDPSLEDSHNSSKIQEDLGPLETSDVVSFAEVGEEVIGSPDHYVDDITHDMVQTVAVTSPTLEDGANDHGIHIKENCSSDDANDNHNEGTEQVAVDLAVGDVIEINGERFKVELPPSSGHSLAGEPLGTVFVSAPV